MSTHVLSKSLWWWLMPALLALIVAGAAGADERKTSILAETTPAPEAAVGCPSAPSSYKTEDDLRTMLRAVPEVGLTRDGLKRLATASPADARGKHALETCLGHESLKLAPLPFDFGPACLSEEKHAKTLESYSAVLRPSLRFGGGAMERTGFLLNFDWVRAETVPTREQMLMGESADWRLALVQQLSFTSGPEASKSLARRALFDLNPELRKNAIDALRKRPAAEYSDVLLSGLRYPWAPIAEHASQAVAELHLKNLQPSLQKLLDLPDPNAPATRKIDGEETLVVPQMVRVNHLKSCLLCHQRSAQREGLVQGSVPDWDQPLPFYDDPNGIARVRADVVYLRQDFSVIQRVDQPRQWPAEQRFDYFYRARRLTPAESTAAAQAANQDYPQRESVRTALRALAK